MNENKLYTVTEASQILRISRDRLYEYLRTGYIRGTRVTGRSAWRIPPSEIERLRGNGKEVIVKQANQDDILSRYRQDYLYTMLKHGEQQKFLELLQQWREQAQFISIAELLRKFCFENWGTELTRELTEPEEVGQVYLTTWAHHLETIPRPYKAMLPVESESLFEQLKQLHPDAEVWQAQESWNEACGIYWDAFSSWFTEVESFTELQMGLSVDEGASEELRSKVREAYRLIKDIKRAKPDVWLFLRLLALALACDLLVLGIQAQPAYAFWASEVVKIKALRGDVVQTSIKTLCKDFSLTGRNRVHAIAKVLWGSDELVKGKTIALLQALKRLRTVQNNVHDKLKALELSLSS